RGRRLADDCRHRARRHRVPNGRSDLRGVQGHRQHGNPPRSEAHRPPGVPLDRHHEERHAEGRAAAAERRAQPRLGAAQGADTAFSHRGDGAAAVEDGKDEDQRRLPGGDGIGQVVATTAREPRRRYSRAGTKDTKTFEAEKAGGWRRPFSFQPAKCARSAMKTTIARKMNRTTRATPIRLVWATWRVPFGLIPVMAAMAARSAAAMSQVYQVMSPRISRVRPERRQLGR